MILEVDTQFKTIKVKGSVNLKELFKWLNTSFPDFAWEEWTMSEHPIVTVPYQPYHNPNPWIGPGTIGGGLYIGDTPFPGGTIVSTNAGDLSRKNSKFM